MIRQKYNSINIKWKGLIRYGIENYYRKQSEDVKIKYENFLIFFLMASINGRNENSVEMDENLNNYLKI